MKKFTALFLALIMIFALSVPAFAADEGYVGKDDSNADDGTNEFLSNDANTNVYLKVGAEAAGNLSATVPLYVRLAVKNDDTIVPPANTAYKISNTGAIAAHVSHVKVEAKNSYTFTKVTFNAAKQMNLTLQPASGTAINLADYTAKTVVPATTASEWNVPTGGNLGLTFAGSVYQVGDITGDTQVFTITYTIAAGTAANS